MKVYRGHKGRIEMEITAKGKSAHAASNHMGDNAVYKMLPVIDAISKMEKICAARFSRAWPGHRYPHFSVSPSTNAVPDESPSSLTAASLLAKRKSIGGQSEGDYPRKNRKDFEIRKLVYPEPSTPVLCTHTNNISPPGAGRSTSLCAGCVKTMKALWDSDSFGQGMWDFSTNGNYWTGKLGIPKHWFWPSMKFTPTPLMSTCR
ncbi:MAG: peptidase dimerization domain-containing protein [Anaerolineaceae bacterium]|nr:peptidase dimerization domain-containing protein [Anaerolineaceae bacterium]